jgi:hypothetical protein
VKHTPGPWTTQEAPHRAWIASVGHNVDDPQIWTVAQVAPGNTYHFGDKEADARLIAAAPDLLALARQYAMECSECDGTGREELPEQPGIVTDCPACADIRAVIAKAEGRT